MTTAQEALALLDAGSTIDTSDPKVIRVIRALEDVGALRSESFNRIDSVRGATIRTTTTSVV